MPTKWTPEREAAAVRDGRGRIIRWKGGRTKAQMKKQRNNFHGTKTHMGREFAEQYGRPATLGEFVRKEMPDGRHHPQSTWYVKTPHGWRDLGTTRKPTAATLARAMKKSRPGTTRRAKKTTARRRTTKPRKRG